MTTIPVQNFTATGTSPAMMVQNAVVSLSGVFVGTLVVEIDPLGDGTWVAATDANGNALSFTGPAVANIFNGIPCLTRLHCTAYTSGTLSARLTGT